MIAAGLEPFSEILGDIAERGARATPKSRMTGLRVLAQLIGPQRVPSPDANSRLSRLADFVSGMNDRYQALAGIFAWRPRYGGGHGP